MRLLISEIRKAYASRAAAVFLIILLAANFALTYYTSRPLPVEEAAREVYREYLRDPEGIIAYMDQLEADFFEHLRDEEFEPPRTYTDGADDVSVLNRVLSRAEYIASYRAETEKIASAAERRARDLGYLGYSGESFYVREQQRLAEVYSSLASVLDSEDSYAYGYDIYLSDSRVCIFILLYLAFAVSFIFRNDRVCGFGCIMRSTKRGRLPSASAKLGTAVLVSIFATFLFLLTSFLAVGMANGGFSSPTAPIQLFPDFAKVPFSTSILGFIAIQTAYRLLAAAVFALFIALIASLGLNYFFCFSISALFAAGNYFVFAHEYKGSAPVLKYLNIASAADGTALFSFHRDTELFGSPVSYPIILAVICLCTIMLLAVMGAYLYCKNLSFGRKKARISLPKVKNGQKSELKLRFCLPIWVYELKKNRALPLSALALLLLAAHGFYVSASVGDGMSYGEAVYYSYIEDICELSSDERIEYLSRERARLDEAVASYEKMTEDMTDGNITYDEYSVFLPEYYDAKNRQSLLSRVEEYSRYISTQSAKLGKELKPVYTTGYENFFASGADLFLFASILALSFGIFTVEYRSGNCAQIVKTAKKGRRHTFFAKILPYAVLGALLSVSARGIGLAVTANKYIMPDPSSPLCSVRAFGSVLSDITIAEYLALDLLCSALAGTLIALAVCALSCLCKKPLQTLGASVFLLALPAILSKSSLALINLSAPNRLFCDSFGYGGEFHQLILVSLLLFHILTAAALTAAAKKNVWDN